MVSVQYKSTVGTFSDRQAAEDALSKLKTAGFPIAQISVTTRKIDHSYQFIITDTSDLPSGDSYAALFGDERSASCATITGSMLGAIGGCLVGIGLLAVPGVGALVAVGTSGTALAATLAGAGIGAVGGGLISALTNSGIPVDQDRFYSDRFSQGDYLVMIDGTDEDVRRAEVILSRS